MFLRSGPTLAGSSWARPGWLGSPRRAKHSAAAVFENPQAAVAPPPASVPLPRGLQGGLRRAVPALSSR